MGTQGVAKLGNLAGPGFSGLFVEIRGALGRCDSLTLNNFEATRGLLWFSEIMFLIEPTSPQVFDRSVLSKSFLLALGVRTNGFVLRAWSGLSLRVRRILNEAIDSTGRHPNHHRCVSPQCFQAESLKHPHRRSGNSGSFSIVTPVLPLTAWV